MTKLEFTKIVFVGILPNITDVQKFKVLMESGKEFGYDLMSFLLKPFIYCTYPVSFPLVLWFLWKEKVRVDVLRAKQQEKFNEEL